MGLRSWFNRVVLSKEAVTSRARAESGQFKADDPATKGENEAYVTSYKKKVRLAKKAKPVKKAKPKTTKSAFIPRAEPKKARKARKRG